MYFLFRTNILALFCSTFLKSGFFDFVLSCCMKLNWFLFLPYTKISYEIRVYTQINTYTYTYTYTHTNTIYYNPDRKRNCYTYLLLNRSINPLVHASVYASSKVHALVHASSNRSTYNTNRQIYTS